MFNINYLEFEIFDLIVCFLQFVNYADSRLCRLLHFLRQNLEFEEQSI